jgi:flagellar basal body-associated protein FliL
MRTTNPVRTLYRILVVTVIALAAAIALVTAGSLAFRAARPGETRIGAELRRKEVMPRKEGYLSLGQIRTATRDRETVVVVHPWFTYPKEDGAFYEELRGKQQGLKSAAGEFFTRLGRAELENEAVIKEDLCKELNGQLVLGKIGAVFFEDYSFFD